MSNCGSKAREVSGAQMDKWQEFKNELNNFIIEMGKSSPVQIEVKSLGENQLMLHNERNNKYVRLDYVSTKELLFIESSAGKRYSVPLRQAWDEVATKVLLEITGNR
jgi:hypothetical protein